MVAAQHPDRGRVYPPDRVHDISRHYLAFHTAEAMRVFTTRGEIAGYFQGIVHDYHARGCRSCRYEDLEVVRLGDECAVATVTWQLLAEDRSIVSAWRESYNLCLVEGRFMVFASTDHR